LFLSDSQTIQKVFQTRISAIEKRRQVARNDLLMQRRTAQIRRDKVIEDSEIVPAAPNQNIVDSESGNVVKDDGDDFFANRFAGNDDDYQDEMIAVRKQKAKQNKQRNARQKLKQRRKQLLLQDWECPLEYDLPKIAAETIEVSGHERPTTFILSAKPEGQRVQIRSENNKTVISNMQGQQIKTLKTYLPGGGLELPSSSEPG